MTEQVKTEQKEPQVIDVKTGVATTAQPPAVLQPSPVANTENYHVGLDSKNGFELAQRAANMLAKSTLVPKEFQNNIPNCVIALNMAYRIGADPLMVMQNLYVVHGRPSWSAQFLIATFNTCGRFSALRFEFFGKKNGDDWGCRAWAIEKSTGQKLVGSDIDLPLAKAEGWHGKAGSKWKTMTQQMLMYRAAAWFVRAYAPELAMGLHTVDENEDIDPVPYDAVTGEIITQETLTAGKVIEGESYTDPEQKTEPKKRKTLENFKKDHADKTDAKPEVKSTIVKNPLPPVEFPKDQDGYPVDNGQGDEE